MENYMQGTVQMKRAVPLLHSIASIRKAILVANSKWGSLSAAGVEPKKKD
jgi:hypothetical protein